MSEAEHQTVCAVVVTHRRPDDWPTPWTRWPARPARPTTSSSSTTTRRATRVRDLVAGQPIPTTYLGSRRNLGGAGGFALGMLHALALGADWVWLADDDGRPADADVLGTLLDCADTAFAGRGVADGVRPRRPGPAGVPAAPRPGLAPARRRAAHRRRRPGPAARHRLAVQRRAVPRLDAGSRWRAGPSAVHPRRRGGDAPPAGALRPAVRHLPGRGVPAPAGLRRVQADPRRPHAHPVPRRRHQALLHLPQPRLPAVAARHAAADPAGVAAVRLVLPGDPTRPGRPREWMRLRRLGRREKFGRAGAPTQGERSDGRETR